MSHITTGLVSVTFRKLPPREIVSLVAQAGLDGIEWGGDVHVPHGDLAAARDVQRMTEDTGLRVLAYGSYFRCRPGEPFKPVLETALALGAPLIRIWAGQLGSAEADAAYREGVVAQSRNAVELAEAHNITVAYEFHEKTLADTGESVVALLRSAPGMQTLWQPSIDVDSPAQLHSLKLVLPWLANVHVIHRDAATRVRLPLAGSERDWRIWLDTASAGNSNLAALLEFVRDDDPEQFLRDTATLLTLINQLYPPQGDWI
jgi:hypothetical protein